MDLLKLAFSNYFEKYYVVFSLLIATHIANIIYVQSYQKSVVSMGLVGGSSAEISLIVTFFFAYTFLLEKAYLHVVSLFPFIGKYSPKPFRESDVHYNLLFKLGIHDSNTPAYLFYMNCLKEIAKDNRKAVYSFGLLVIAIVEAWMCKKNSLVYLVVKSGLPVVYVVSGLIYYAAVSKFFFGSYAVVREMRWYVGMDYINMEARKELFPNLASKK